MTAASIASPAPTATGSARPIAISRWLLAVAALVFLIVVVGGITRLTESGLSMTRWEPISGVVPPLNAEQWNAEFAAYKATPEYQKVNRGMSLGQFKQIFFWEYLHRLIGRLIGVVFAVPFIWFAMRRAIPPGYGWRLSALLALGGLQGAIGWWMVASGLIDRPDVSHIRLAIHLVTALFIFGGLIWTALDLRQLARDPGARPARLRGLAIAVLALFGIQLLLGAFTAGLDAGYAFAEWPMMGGRFFPEAVPFIEPVWRNLVDQPIVVQFAHRWFAWAVTAAAIFLAIKGKRAGVRNAWIVHALVTLQIGLGIATLLSGVAIPIAVAHQAVAALLLAGLVIVAHGLGTQKR